ncbi:MAG: T9SS type A sorting domain-containing protein [Candidatus Eisenbacteria bacterium]|uniref:T9SS type A sorting domain-containing protein n=1 Tax=Eiseniibacteriota bacterium TaxID=2212470 RepID=A0A933W7X8_UNCEI|nr:T9SS type A sorting domain-containing protein [Candidatus Eisenbacteria bacterium]
MKLRLLSALLAVCVLASPAAAQKKALFDNAHAETAGNADWVIDDTQPIPSPAQSGITAGTAFTYWNGAISSWGVSLVKRGYTVHTNTTALTYGNTGNTYDLANYDVLIIPEPNTVFTAAEKTAIFNFVQNGGGLVAVADHAVSDRNNDGWDSPMIWNDLDPTHLLGISCASTGNANNNIVQTSTNVNALSTDMVTRGPVGNVTGLAFHNGTTFTLWPAVNSTVRGEVWMNGLAQTSTTGLMCASSQYGSGRVVFIGDSSPIDDGTAQAGNTSIFNGWGEVGATDSTLAMNATLWVTRTGATDVTAPTVALTAPAGGVTWKAGSVQAITWTASDNVGVTAVDLAYSTDGGATYPNTIATGLANSGTYNWTLPNVNSTTVRVRVTARDAAGNSASAANTANFTIDQWVITASAGANGTISPSGAVGVMQGANQAFTIAANAGFAVSSVLVDGVSAGAVTSYTFTNVTAAHTIAASFTATSTSYTITASAGTGGTISPSGAVSVAAGANQSFTIAANASFTILSVLVDGASVGAVTSYTFTNVQAAHTISASFTSSSNTGWPMASGNYSEAFGDIANWANNFASGVGASYWASVAVGGSTTIPSATKITTSTSTFTTTTTGGVQKGVSPNPVGTIVLLSTGSTDNTSSAAIDLKLNFTSTNAGTLGFTWSTVFNSTGNRKASLRVYTSPDGTTWTELTGAAVLNFTNNVAGSGTVSAVALPATLNNQPNARVRFYYYNGTGGTTGSRPKIALDNVSVTGTPSGAFANPAQGEDGGPIAAGRAEFAFSRVVPNPGGAETTLQFSLARAGKARLEIVDLSGRRVWASEGEYAAGAQFMRWSGRASDGSAVRAGVYFVRLVTADGVRSGRMVRF